MIDAEIHTDTSFGFRADTDETRVPARSSRSAVCNTFGGGVKIMYTLSRTAGA
jgi:hypothetical protein